MDLPCYLTLMSSCYPTGIIICAVYHFIAVSKLRWRKGKGVEPGEKLIQFWIRLDQFIYK